MNNDAALKRVIHREMRAHFVWHQIDKIEPESNGYHIVVSMRSNPWEYSAAADLVTALKRHYRSVHLDNAVSYSNLRNNSIFSMSITCNKPKLAMKIAA